MLAAVDLLANASAAAVAAGKPFAYRRRLAFAALAGEPWGYMGSKRLLWEAASGENSTEGLALERVSQVGPAGCCVRAAAWTAPGLRSAVNASWQRAMTHLAIHANTCQGMYR